MRPCAISSSGEIGVAGPGRDAEVKIEPRRRELLMGAGAAAAASVMPDHRAVAGGETTSRPSSDLAYRSATDLVAALTGKRVSSVELTDSAISRIEALDKPINAVVVRDFERARAAATAADASLARGETRPLLGLPMTVKESFNLAGLPTTWGNPKFQGWQPNFDALAVTRLKAAGAVILGKTNVPFMLEDWQSYNEIYGTTNNPWKLDRTPGGSSGGAAAALAAGFVSLELGSDIGGSLRCPAHFCGVFAHKPSLDLVPLHGAGPPHVRDVPIRSGLAVAGPMARSAADLAVELEVLALPDETTEGIAYKLALPPARHRDLKSFRVLVIDTHPLCPTAASVQAALDRLAVRLGQIGASVARASPLLPDLGELARRHVELIAAGRSADLPDTVYRQAEEAAKYLADDPDWSAAARARGLAISHRDWILGNRSLVRPHQQIHELFNSFDVVLCPPMPTPAFPHDHSPFELGRSLHVGGTQVPYSHQIIWASMATVLGLPATVAPIGHSAEGLPIGVQIVGPYLEDRTTIRFAGLIEREFGGFVAPSAH
jgi:amidase